MIPSLLAREIRTSIADFLTTEFRPATPRFQGLIEQFLQQPEAVFKGPYLSIGLPFRQGTVGKDYFPDVPMAFSPHRHQQLAFARLQAPQYQSTLVATGTGSGKTECYMLPILDYCYQNREQQGIKAILIYPMNALATDQAKRLASLIWHNPNLKGKVSAGLFVGESEREPKILMGEDHLITDKNLLRQNPPDIILTNYKMLDYLLIRPRDQQIWANNTPDTLRYLVVDEIHTFDGAQGTDLACLIRRLKARLKTPAQHLVCVGTSATLGTGNAKQEMLAYAQTVFNEPFDETAIIEEDRLSSAEFLADAFIDPLPIPSPAVIEQLNPNYYSSLETYLESQYELWFHRSLDGTFTNIETRIELGDRLKSLPIIHNLLKILDTDQVISLEKLWQELNKKMSLPHIPHSEQTEYSVLLLDSLIALCAIARNQENRPWVNLRVQFWLRELRRMVAKVNPQPTLVYTDDLTPEEKQNTLPVMHCRSCGSTAWGGLRKQTGDRKISGELQDFYRAFFAKNPLTTYIFPSDESPETGWRSWKLCCDCLTLTRRDAHHCSRCGGERLINVIEPDNILHTSQRGGQTKRMVSHDCPICETKNGLAILGSRAASLASAAIGSLYASRYNDDHKLITFSDSVQDAAHRAGFFEARTYRTTLRSALCQYLQYQGNGQTLEDIRTQFPTYWRSQLFNGNDADYVATFMPSDMEWLKEWEDLQATGKAAESLVDLINKRLDWEVVGEIGLKNSLGGSLERTESCGVGVDESLLQTAIAQLLEILPNEIGGLETLTEHTLQQFILGFVYHLRQRGGIIHSVTESYITSGGNTFLLQRPLFMPGFGPASLTPTYFSNYTVPRFETLLRTSEKSTWAETWGFKLFMSYSPLIISQLENLYDLTLKTLVEQGIFQVYSTNKKAKVWGIQQSALRLYTESQTLKCDHCGHRVTATPKDLSTWEKMPCLRPLCQGHYQTVPSPSGNFYRNLYTKGTLWRIFAREHTSLLDREVREELETQFITGQRRSDPNLLSATSTLEMGIDIGDLSSVLLCSVPPGQANYQQRIGRAGRRDGNAFITAIANGTPHDLFFWAEPMKMINGDVSPPGSYLNASAILQRQLTAYCLDQWVSKGIAPGQLLEELGTVLNTVQSVKESHFPYPWIQFVEEQQQQLLKDFLELFQEEISERTQTKLQHFIEKGQNHEGGLTWRILNRLQEVVKERTRLKNQIETLRRRIKEKEKAAHSQNYEEEMAELKRERSGLMELVKNINQKNIFNFLTDEGLLPNYAFPEPGVTLRSIIWRRNNSQGNSQGKQYETRTFEYERPGAIAIKELVPSGVFYAEGKRVSIDQIDLNLSKIEEWRLCRNCSYAVPTLHPTAKQSTCPRCNDPMWSDEGRKRKMVRLRQVMATTNARESRIVDDRDERSPAFFTRQLLVDFEPSCCESSYLIEEETFPFGFEFLSRVTFRDINFGESSLQAESFEVAGESRARAGFRICRSCGKVQRDPEKPNHALTCATRNQSNNDEDFLEVLYLFREFHSEAIRFLLPIDTLNSDDKLHSFIAALQLGLKSYFKGNVDHLKTLIIKEPSTDSSSLLRKPFLFLYDTVPGGTGYLRQLVQHPDNLFSLFQQALDVIRACNCQDGCYNCVYAYRNSFDQDRTSRKIARDLLNEILSRQSLLKPSPQSLSQTSFNALFDSVLEQRFIEAIRRHRHQDHPTVVRSEIINGKAGYYIQMGQQSWMIEPQVELGIEEGISVPSRADFIFYPVKNTSHVLPIVIFTDGWQYHANRLKTDFAQRMAIAKSGNYHVWSLTWSDVESQLNQTKKIDYYTNFLNEEANDTFHRTKNTLYKQYNCETFISFITANSFNWLMEFLTNPAQIPWEKFALVSTLAHIDVNFSKDKLKRQQWEKEVQSIMSPDVWSQFKNSLSTQLLLGLIEKLSTNQDALCKLYTAISPKEHRNNEAQSAFVILWINDKNAIEEEKKRVWNGLLRQFNLLQFLPYTYIITNQDFSEVNFNSLSVDRKNSSFELSNVDQEQWQELKSLLFEETALILFDYMQSHQWLLPEVGFELTNQMGTVIAEAEIAWTDRKIALVTDELDVEPLKNEPWQVFTIASVLEDMELFYQTYLT
ncbi:DEAD/DEAH box helicase [Crocosphaera watsonii]|uniref:Helicase, C-terminal:Type III restriction enzyme, res subunit:DEAD/DEAH box helicase, N-terminal n=1 Tax=Crocosphaera watsonii WH 0401 TaxID=555881 RepID=T2JFN1_CROWT|nr:DEAD/DEAH box helicase [Crocosphaera watsonii]CCQ63921.1 Helicase, C-terminal:Type III restriction enzyme, res subunit:DEAD/DEAH box helicase, N-terminal [Crocosphaera watsonii WH 0401]